VRAVSKVINEKEVFALHVTRVIPERDRLLRRTKGMFWMTKAGTSIRLNGQARVLYGLPLRTFLREPNLAYLDRWPGVSLLQSTTAYPLLMVSTLMDGWVYVDTVSRELLLREVL